MWGSDEPCDAKTGRDFWNPCILARSKEKEGHVFNNQARIPKFVKGGAGLSRSFPSLPFSLPPLSPLEVEPLK